MKKLLVVDGNSILNRAFYGIRPLKTKDGLFTNAIYGMVTILERHLQTYHPDYFAVAFDMRAKTFRHKFSESYKANRHGMPEELAVQLEPAKECLRAMGALVLSKEGYEADDILGTLAAMAEQENVMTYIVTGDRDSLQLITEKTNVVLATNMEPLLFDTKAFFEKYGVLPSQFVDVKALMGDSSDNIPGVPGIGEKTALKLIAEYGDLDSIYDGLETKKLAKGTLTKLEAGKASAYDSRFLARIVNDVPLEIELSDAIYEGHHKEELRDLFKKFEFYALMKKLDLEEEEKEKETELKIREISAKETEWKKDVFYAVSFDFEENVAAVSNGEEIVSIRGIESLKPLLDGDFRVVVYDEKTALHALEIYGISFRACAEDILLMAYIAALTDNDFSFDKLTQRLLSKTAGSLAEKAYLTGELYKVLERELVKSEQTELYRKIEFPLCRVLYEMEREGFSVDVEALKAFSVRLGEMQEEFASRVYMLAGEEFNINSPKQLGNILFEKLGFPHAKKTKTGYSTNAEVLEKLRPYHPIIGDILDFRQYGKLKSTYADGLAAAADENGKVHTSFRQALTTTGRLSSTEPNLQNIPVKTELGREFRKFFVAGSDDYVLIDADYSQIELRLLAAISKDEAMTEAFLSGYDIHTATAMKIFGVTAENVTIDLRKRAKAINFGIVYGMGEFSLASDLKISRIDAKNYIDGYLGAYPKVSEYLKNIVSSAKQEGFVTTLFGRRRYIPELSSSKKMEVAFGERVAMNSPIQGTAADIIKLAMVNIDKKLKEKGFDARLILQVHDELIIEAHKSCADEVRNLLKHEMENAVKLSVPLTVEISEGKSWYEAK
ncbi:MAG: DNA polymerase I [Ruminococcaceae bacterium]|nr:DNA polymerase I [Oscillospiraceae bacterium]